MKTISNWNDKQIEVACSRGGVLAVINPTDNLITTGISLWPCPEIIQKLYQSRHARAFNSPDLEAVKRVLGFYSDLQSLHSEDAITWSVFGTLAYADHTIVLGEAKWLSNVGQAQGKAKDKDQITLRQEFFEKYGKVIFDGVSHYVVLSLSLCGGILHNEIRQLEQACLHFRDTTWQTMCNFAEHPVVDELQRYLKWKVANSKGISDSIGETA